MSLFGWTGSAEAQPPIQQYQLEPLPGNARWTSGTGHTVANWIRHQYQPGWMGNPEDIAMQMAMAKKIGVTPPPALAGSARLVDPRLMDYYDKKINYNATNNSKNVTEENPTTSTDVNTGFIALIIGMIIAVILRWWAFRE